MISTSQTLTHLPNWWYWWLSAMECVTESKRRHLTFYPGFLTQVWVGAGQDVSECCDDRQPLSARTLSMSRHAVACHSLLSHECESVPKATDHRSHQRNQQNNIFHFRKRLGGMSKRLPGQTDMLPVYLVLLFCHKNNYTLWGIVGVQNDIIAFYFHFQLILAKITRLIIIQTCYLFQNKIWERVCLASVTINTTMSNYTTEDCIFFYGTGNWVPQDIKQLHTFDCSPFTLPFWKRQYKKAAEGVGGIQ